MRSVAKAVTVGAVLMVCGTWISAAFAADDPRNPAYLDAKSAGPDFITQGEYQDVDFPNSKWGLEVIARGNGKFDAVLFPDGLPGETTDGKNKIPLKGETADGQTKLTGDEYSADLKDDAATLKLPGGGERKLKKMERKSPTLGAKPPAGAIVLFDGSNLDEWETGKIEENHLLGVGDRTKRKFKNFTLHLEFRLPYMPLSRGQGRGNSGMYLIDQYECQILDSFGLKGANNECGGFYQIAAPLKNMCFPPLSWQTYDVDFTAAKFDAAGTKTNPAVVTIRHNGVVIHDNFQIPRNTPGGGLNDESQPGSLFLQDHGNPVRFRNIWIVEKSQ